ncbi:1-deoxy-D-xylulose-5-phosphate synthase [Thermotoga sp. Ku-13t]|uniref:1-deoxy-D-xylulose-5-phosphate synthase n=1 Tax=Thermotoga sp. Ku-13t TaxID=1755813 RepID=UPI0013EDC33D|nr:1-deoxy-D-xylulose-5-phosphate synthase [Thermotoga sp. Ku-13t]KAF2958108.1 1-deoxy-D-xylulose-5-phosphate synthase [Thermotoga sp. Ku-13t]
MTIDQLKDARIEDLERFAELIRKRIIDVVSQNGGHLASNLGVVELTLALYKVFDPRENIIVWDTSHQCYAHKLLTYRWEEFSTLRKLGGISGFNSIKENALDRFGAGHAGTAIAAALGIEKGLKLLGEKKNVIVVLGDGALTNGETLESLNQLKSLNSKLKIVLNDNGMSISKNVGALSEAFAKLRTSQVYVMFKNLVKKVLSASPTGKNLEEELRRFREGLKQFIQGIDFFEALGLKHIGPVDGHDLKLLVELFERIKDYDYPVVVHVVTQKGKGYKPAEENCVFFHSPPKFDPESGEPVVREGWLSYSDVFGETLVRLARKDKRLFAITAAMPDGTGLRKFSEAFPDRFVDLGITEQSCVTFAAGLASAGFRPVVAIYSTFLQRAYDQIIHDVALQNLNVIFAVDRAGLVGEDGPTHHGVFDIAFFRTVPNSRIFAPCCLQELINVLRSVVEMDIKGVVAIRYPRQAEEGNFDDMWKKSVLIDPFRWEIVREGKNVAILAVGTMVQNVLKANLDATVVYVRCVKPLDETMLERVAETHELIVTVEEGIISGGFGESVLNYLNRKDWRRSILLIGINDEFVPHGSREELLKLKGLDPEGIRERVLSLLRKEVGLCGDQAGIWRP